MYDSLAASPRILDVSDEDIREFIEELSSRTYACVCELGGSIPYSVVREVVENLIHADFREVVVSVLPGGAEVRFADQGPGIADKTRAMLPGFTTASADMKRFIRGVGSGLPLVREYLAHSGGTLVIEDNLGGGTVVTLSSGAVPVPGGGSHAPTNGCAADPVPPVAAPRLSLRQNKVLSLVLEYGEVGPSLVSRELGVGLSTAHRDLAALEGHGLIVSDETGKRVLTAAGTAYLDALFS